MSCSSAPHIETRGLLALDADLLGDHRGVRRHPLGVAAGPPVVRRAGGPAGPGTSLASLRSPSAIARLPGRMAFMRHAEALRRLVGEDEAQAEEERQRVRGGASSPLDDQQDQRRGGEHQQPTTPGGPP